MITLDKHDTENSRLGTCCVWVLYSSFSANEIKPCILPSITKITIVLLLDYIVREIELKTLIRPLLYYILVRYRYEQHMINPIRGYAYVCMRD